MDEYIEYLKRLTRISNMSQREAHQRMLSRLIAIEYGVTDEQLKWLDDNL